MAVLEGTAVAIFNILFRWHLFSQNITISLLHVLSDAAGNTAE